jgi:hypothetical protein
MVRWRQDPEAMIEEEYPSEDFEYMEMGPSPPAESAPNSMYDSFEETATTDSSILISRETLRNNLIEQMKTIGNNGDVKFFEDVELGNIVAANCVEILSEIGKIEKNLLYLWSAFLKRWDILESLLEIGADLYFYESNGYSALHLAAFSGCLTSISFLLSRKIDPNFHTKCGTPLHFAAFGNSPEAVKMLLNNGAKIHNGNGNSNKLSADESLLHCAVRSNAIDCLKIFIEEGADVNQLRSNGTNSIHVCISSLCSRRYLLKSFIVV